ncbi:heparinase II/III family protein, partial [Candidatus Sumerlaeota bacterium]|nr:heparinase II/III family protein [Candidatus Sumerlaeota bacterium]
MSGHVGSLRTRTLVAALVAIAFASWPAEKPQQPSKGPRDLLTGTYSREFLVAKMLPRDKWRPFPRAQDRDAWQAFQAHPLNRARKDYVAQTAEALVGQPWPALPATLYMEYARVGNRKNYQDPYFKRRQNLAALVLAECMECRGRFLDEIANGIWAICEESTWCIPAHVARMSKDVLPRLDIETLDLFACETGMLMAQTRYLLQKELDAFSPALCERIRREVYRRILDPYAAGDKFGSSGWIAGGNNWAPWCASNVMGAAMHLEGDPEKLASMTVRLMRVVDRFINRYGEDGGCDEGPSYWNYAGGAMLVFLELLRSRTDGAVDIYQSPKIAAMGRYIAHAHLGGPWFANFCDADPKPDLHPGQIYRFGERIGSEGMKNLALLYMHSGRSDGPVDPPLRLPRIRQLFGPLMEMFWIPSDAKLGDLRPEPQVWLPDVEALFARERTDSEKGLVLAAKGSHNAESHNHNDTGHFILSLDGQPGIIDIGRETYSRQTFGAQRYELLFARGLGHNAPVVNGVEQAPGSQYRATDVHFDQKDFGPALAMNLEKAYPAKAGLRSLRREFELHRGSDPHVVVRDSFELAAAKAKIVVP